MFILRKILNFNSVIYIFILLISLFLAVNEYVKINQLNIINKKLLNNELIINDDYEELSLYSSAYLLGIQGEYENALEKYNMLLFFFDWFSILPRISSRIACLSFRVIC